MKQLLSVIAPMYNEQELVKEYCEKTLSALKAIDALYDVELVLVNDGSSDTTLEVMNQMQQHYPKQIAIINLSRNFGLEGAVNAGLKKATGDGVVVMDADLQDPPSLIVEMVKKWEQGADIVIAARIKRRHDNLFKRFTANVYYWILDSLSGKLKLEKNAANFRLLSRKAVDQLLSLPEVNGIFRVTVPFIGMKTAIVEYDRDPRFAGKTKYRFSSMLSYALNSLTGISIEPLRKIIWTVPITAAILIISLLGTLLTRGNWQIGFMLLLCLAFFFGMLFICIALIGEYIGQILTETKGRPTSIIYEYKPSDTIREVK